MPTAKVTKNVSAAIGGGNVMCSTLISIKTKAWIYSFRCDTLYFIDTFYTHPYRVNSHMLAYQLSVCLMGIVSQRYLPCLYCMQGCNLKVHYKISTLRFAEVVFCSETLHT